MLYVAMHGKQLFLPTFDFQVDKVVGEMEQKCEQKVAKCKEESRLQLSRIQEENAAIVCPRN